MQLTARRPVVMGTRGMVAAAHPLASLAGLDILRAGGNAVDAAIATNAALNVTQPGSCGIGGDLFAMVYWAAEKKVYLLNASGRTPAAATWEELRRRGHQHVPGRGMLSVTVPGCVDGWFEMNKRFGTRRMGTLLTDAIRLAANGFPLSHQVQRQIAVTQQTLQPHPSWTATYAPEGNVPKVGRLFKQPELAKSLSEISTSGRGVFYKGRIAEAIVQASQELGGLLTREDLAEHRSTWDEPLSTNYRGYTVLEAPPNTQGIAALIALNICQGWNLNGMAWDDALRVHRMVEAKKLAFADRDQFVADPAFSQIPLDRLLSYAHAADLRGKTDDSTASPVATVPPGNGGTTYFAVADAAGNLVSCIQSNFQGFGALVVPTGTGISLHNRGAYFRLDPKHPNCIAPRKRPFHTLIPGMVFRGEDPVLVFGTMGGDGQAQTHQQLLSNLFDHGMNIQEAIEAPRWLHGPLLDGDHPNILRLEKGFPSSVVEGLRSRGHRIEIVSELYHAMGHAQGIIIDDGTYMGGADPRGDGYALGW